MERYTIYMATDTTLIKQTLTSRSLIRNKDGPFVVFPLELWERLEDILMEIASPRLLRSIAAGRRAYKSGNTIAYKSFRKKLGLI